MKKYWAVYLILLAMTLTTVAVSRLELGRQTTLALAFAIASFKASLIVFYFMHLKDENFLLRGILFVGLVCVLILIIGIIPDVGLYRF